jgi:hypothetical protein
MARGHTAIVQNLYLKCHGVVKKIGDCYYHNGIKKYEVPQITEKFSVIHLLSVVKFIFL